MGQRFAAPDVEAEIAQLPPPRQDARLWMASCRPVCSMSRLSDDLLIFQPDARLFCAEAGPPVHLPPP